MASGVQALGGLGQSFELTNADTGVGIISTFGSRNPELLQAIMITSGGLSGGVSSTIAGGNFWDGMRQGLITAGLNHVAHLTVNSLDKITFNSVDELKNKYPRFYKVLSKLQSYAANNENVMNALVEYSGYSRAELVELLKIENLGMLPLKVKEFQSVKINGNGKEIREQWHGFGETKHKSPFTMTINKSWVLGLEKAYLSTTINGTSFALAVTVYHELVHYGRFIHGLEQNYEYGHGFEIDAFGEIINGNNANNKSVQYGWKF